MERKILHKVQEDCHLKNRDKADKFNLATDDENIDFNIFRHVPNDEAVKRSQNFNILELDSENRQVIHSKKQFRMTSNNSNHASMHSANESKVAIMDAGNTLRLCEIVNVEPKWQCKVCR